MKKSNETTAVIGVAWYRINQWQRLRAVSIDADNLEDTYEEWLREAEQKVAEFRALGLCVEKVDVDVEQLIAWYNERGRELMVVLGRFMSRRSCASATKVPFNAAVRSIKPESEMRGRGYGRKHGPLTLRYFRGPV